MTKGRKIENSESKRRGSGGPSPEEEVAREMRRAPVDAFISRHTGGGGEQGAVQDMWGNLVNPGG